MSKKGKQSPIPSPKAIRKALGRLVRNGADPYWVGEDGYVLLGLRCVEDRVDKDFKGKPEASALALIEILRERVEEIEKKPTRKLLWIIFDFDRDYPDSTAKVRRTVAGERFREGKKPVTHGTVRQYHEPRALDRLSELLVDYERRARGASNE
ncbi:MAG: hypothetical protein ACJ76D_03185 [Solirubrobacterales bacterium]